MSVNPGNTADVEDRVRTVEISMDSLEFDPKSVDVEAGETIRFVVQNQGKIAHDFTVGTMVMQEARRSFIRVLHDGDVLDSDNKSSNVRDHPNAVYVAAGQTKELVWTFKTKQSIEFGCNIPLHYEAGMRGQFSISDPAIPPVSRKTPIATAPPPPPNTRVSLAENATARLAPRIVKPKKKAKLTANAPRRHKTPLSTNGNWMIQLASVRNRDEAHHEWRRLLGRFPIIMGGKQPIISRAHVDERGVFFRLRLGGFERKSRATITCTFIRARGSKCLALRGKSRKAT